MYQVKITKKIEQELAKAFRSEEFNTFALAFLLGKRKRNVVTAIASLNADEDDMSGCEEMQRIYPDILTRAALKMRKKGITPCGIARVGYFEKDCCSPEACEKCSGNKTCDKLTLDSTYNPYNLTQSLLDIRKMGNCMYILSYSDSGMEAHRIKKQRIPIRYPVKVLKS